MIPRRYGTPDAFKAALEARIGERARELSMDMGRFRQLRLFDRFLARISAHFGDRAVIKGGIVLELRLERARATKDIDLRLMGDPGAILIELRRAGQLDFGDFLTFSIDPDPDHPTMEGDGVTYEGQRFRVQGRLAGKIYGRAFGVDIAFGDRMAVPPEMLDGSDFFEFVGIPRTKLCVYAREVHLAEKLHAFTLPRPRENSRVKDLPDIALLGTTGPFTSASLQSAIKVTFDHRGTHAPPGELPAPPESWAKQYARMAQENGLPWGSLEILAEAVRVFLNPVLRGDEGIWDHRAWTWRSASVSRR